MTAGEIKSLRQRAGIAQWELAYLLGKSATAVGRWELGGYSPDEGVVALLDAFAEAEDKQPGTLKRAVNTIYVRGFARALHEVLDAAFRGGTT